MSSTEITWKWLTAPAPTPVLRGLCSRRACGTVPGSRAHPLHANCYCPVVTTAQLCSRHENRWGCYQRGTVTHHLIWFYGTIWPQNSFRVCPVMCEVVLPCHHHLLSPHRPASQLCSLQPHSDLTWQAPFSSASSECWGDYDTERSGHSPWSCTGLCHKPPEQEKERQAPRGSWDFFTWSFLGWDLTWALGNGPSCPQGLRLGHCLPRLS